MHDTTLAHLTWHASDVQRTKTFLEDLLGWSFDEVGDDYYVWQPPTGTRVGLTYGLSSGVGVSAFLPQIAVDDLAETVKRARQLEASSVESEGSIENVGIYADLRDPDGSLFTLIEFRTQNASVASPT
jgi:predicted enzyme related to lactoylglutathione lyase